MTGQGGGRLPCLQAIGQTGSDGTCRALRNDGETCDASTMPCRSDNCCGGVCCGGICDDLNGGATPGDPTTGTCKAAQSLIFGEACRRAAWCHSALYCETGADAAAAGTCASKKAVGGPCANQGDSECDRASSYQRTQPNFCDTGTDLCTARFAVGQACTADNQCVEASSGPETQCFGSSTAPDQCRYRSDLGGLCGGSQNCKPLPWEEDGDTGTNRNEDCSAQCEADVCVRSCQSARTPCVANVADGTACDYTPYDSVTQKDVCRCAGPSSFCTVDGTDETCTARLADGATGCQSAWTEGADRWPGVGDWDSGTDRIDGPRKGGPGTSYWDADAWEWVTLGHSVSDDRHCQEGSVCLENPAATPGSWSGTCVATKEFGDACDAPDGVAAAIFESDPGYHSQCPGYCLNAVCTAPKAAGDACSAHFECGYDRKRHQWSVAGQLACFSGQCKASCIEPYTEGHPWESDAPPGVLGARCASNEFCASDPSPPGGGAFSMEIFGGYLSMDHPSSCDALAADGELCGASTDLVKPCAGHTPHGEEYKWIWDFQTGIADATACIGQGGGGASAEHRCGRIKRDGDECDGDNTPDTDATAAAFSNEDFANGAPAAVGYNGQCLLGSCDLGTPGWCTAPTECTGDDECGPIMNCIGASTGTPGTCRRKCANWQRCDPHPCTYDAYGNLVGEVKGCADGEYCESESCLVRKAVGEDCARDAACVVNVFCFEGTCTVAREEGEACDRPEQCQGYEDGETICEDTDDDGVLDTCQCNTAGLSGLPKYVCMAKTRLIFQILLAFIAGVILLAVCGAVFAVLCASSKKKHVDGEEVGRLELNVQKSKAPWKFVSSP